jgi:hypothetical protein
MKMCARKKKLRNFNCSISKYFKNTEIQSAIDSTAIKDISSGTL